MGYLTAKQFSGIWGITERRIIKLCSENRINGARKNGMVWEIPEETLKPSDKRSNIYKYINIEKKVMVVNVKEELKEYLLEILNKEGYIVEFEEINSAEENFDKYYEGLIYFVVNNLDNKDETFLTNYSNRLNSDSSIVVVDYNYPNRNKVENKLAYKFKNDIGLKINTLVLDINQEIDYLINYDEIAEDIINLLLRLKNTTGGDNMIHFVGAGSGAADLITVRGKKYLEDADVEMIFLYLY